MLVIPTPQAASWQILHVNSKLLTKQVLSALSKSKSSTSFM